jgi:hypothetical protein
MRRVAGQEMCWCSDERCAVLAWREAWNWRV